MRWVTTLLFLVATGGCADFQLAGAKKSVVVEQVAPRTITVNFCGSAYMSQQDVERYALQRAAEETMAKGYSHFVVLKKKDNSQFCSLGSNDKRDAFQSQDLSQQESTPVDLPVYSKPNVTLTVQCYAQDEQKPENALDAEAYLRENFPGLNTTRA